VYLALAPVRAGGAGAAGAEGDPFCGHMFLFRSKRADRVLLLKIVWKRARIV
jgi:hypothetical protein